MKREEKKVLFEKILAKNQDSLYRVCRSYLYDREHLNDLFQEVLIAIWQSLDRFRGKSSWDTFVYRIAVNTAINYNLKVKKRRPYEQQIPREVQSIPAESKHQEDQNQQLRQLQQSIRQLREPDRMLIGLVLEELSYKEIADILGISISNVGARINRVKSRLKKIMYSYENRI